MGEEVPSVLRLDYLSCVLTICSTILIGKRCWEGWVLAAVNSVLFCIIGVRTEQWGFIPANVFCIALYAVNLKTWRKADA
jgi:hypothetical protein